MYVHNRALRVLLDVFEDPESCAILGAGASAPLVPLMPELRQRVRARLLSCGVFPAERLIRDRIADRVLGPPAAAISPWDDKALIQEKLLAEHVSSAAVHASAIESLVPPDYSRVPAQYDVFNLSRHRMTLLSYNNDGLVRRHCRRHQIVDVHGLAPDAASLERYSWDDTIDTLQEFPGLPPPAVPGLYLPQAESLLLASERAYAQFAETLRRTKRAAIIGYSFGEGDDWVGYACLLNSFMTRRVPVVIVNPRAFDIGGRLEHDAKTNTVSNLAMRWDAVSCAILKSRHDMLRKSCDHRRLCGRCIEYSYEAFLDCGLNADEFSARHELTAMFRPSRHLAEV